MALFHRHLGVHSSVAKWRSEVIDAIPEPCLISFFHFSSFLSPLLLILFLQTPKGMFGSHCLLLLLRVTRRNEGGGWREIRVGGGSRGIGGNGEKGAVMGGLSHQLNVTSPSQQAGSDLTMSVLTHPLTLELLQSWTVHASLSCCSCCMWTLLSFCL